MNMTAALRLIILSIVLLLTACGDGDNDSSSSFNTSVDHTSFGNPKTASEDIHIVGAGVKGPLAFADAKIFLLDPTSPDFYDKNSPIASAMTNESAQIVGLSIPAITAPPPYILTIGGDHAIDLNTGEAPVISTLITVITDDMLASERPIYSTPLTTMAFQMARHGTSVSADASDFIQQLMNTSSRVSRLFAIDQNIEIDIFTSPLMINDNTVTTTEQEKAVHHRAAIEAFAAKVHILSLSNDNIGPDSVIERLAQDLQSDGVIDNAVHGTSITGINLAIISQDPMKLVIPNTQHLVEDIMTIMEDERILTGTATGPIFHKNSITLPITAVPVVTPDPIVTPVSVPVVTPDPIVTPISAQVDPTPVNESIITLSTNNIDFGNHDIGTISNPTPLTLTNSGTSPMTISEITVPPNFIATNNCNNYLPAGENCTIGVSFVPTVSGNSTGEVTLTGNATNSPYVVQLSGTSSTLPLSTTARYLSEDFESVDWADRYKVFGNLTREGGVAARTGSYGIRINVLEGQKWGGRILFDHSRHGQGGNFDEIWARYYVRFGPNWRRDDSRMGKTGFRARSAEECGAPCLEMTDSHKLTDSGSIAGIAYYHKGVSTRDLETNSANFGHRFWTSGEREREQWYCVETHHVLNTPGENNGIYQNWLDGTLVSDHRSIRQRDLATFDIDDSVLIAFIGGSWRADRDMSVYFDDWAVSDERIGCQ